MSAAPLFDDNPCRPRHFKPPPCAPVVADGPAKDALETCRTRLVVTAALFVLGFLVVAARMVDVVLLGGGGEQPVAHVRPAALPTRADIVDRNGRLVAATLERASLYADPQQVPDPAAAAAALARALPELPQAEVLEKLKSGKKFVWLQRHLTPRQEYDVNDLGIPGLQFLHEPWRFYPYGDLAAHLVGYTGIDDKGLAGVERGLDKRLEQQRGPLTLALDLRIQYVVREELQKVIDDFTAKGAAGLVMNVNTGEVLAMVSLPDFDPNRPAAGPPPGSEAADAANPLFNRITLGDYEIGSVFKIFTLAMALDSGVAKMTSVYDAANPIHVGRFTITDYHGKHRPLSVPEILMYSSNLGAARIGVACGAQMQQAFLKKLGLLAPPKVELDEIGAPHFPKPWREVNVMTIAFGHGISETPLQIATAASALVNGGILRPATLLQVPPGDAPQGQRVISEKTSEEMRQLMRLVVEHGTGKMAAAPGYVVGGKTGTAEKVRGGSYAEKKLLSSFLGVFPMNDPKYLVLLMVDQPHPNKESHGYATAGWTVAPATSRVITRIAPLLGVPPVDEDAPQVAGPLMVQSLQGKKIEDY
jgi:cell division protein FtsI (penicillin-binding protein 3)